MRDNAFSASLPQNGSEGSEIHSVAGKEAERVIWERKTKISVF